MSMGQLLLWTAVGAGVAILGWGLHRFCLNLERRGLLYYWHKRPSSGAASSFVALQQYLEPGTRHVIEQNQEHVEQQDESGEPDPSHQNAK